MPSFPIQTGKKTFVDSFGNTESTTKCSALGPLPVADESRTGPRFQPIRYSADAKKDWRTAGPEVKHAGNSGLNDPAYIELLRKLGRSW